MIGKVRTYVGQGIGSIVFGLVMALISWMAPGGAEAVPVTVEFAIVGSYSIFGHMPVPQINGFDYAITAEQIENRLAGQSFRITRIGLTAEGFSAGNRLNFDVEIHLSGRAISLEPGQYIKTLRDPVAGHVRIANAQFLPVVGDISFSGAFDLVVGYDGATNGVTALPSLAAIKSLPNEFLDLTDGLHAQVFLWTGDGSNVRAEFQNMHLVVEGDASLGFPQPVPEPGTLALVGSGLFGIAFASWRGRQRENCAKHVGMSKGAHLAM